MPEPEVKTLKNMMLLPPRPDVCQVCAQDHPPEYPHNQQSLYYQMYFHQQHGRYPTWHDAMAHCDVAMKTLWTKGLREMGVDI